MEIDRRKQYTGNYVEDQIGGSVAAWDRYADVENNPLRYTDPSGHISEDDAIKLLGFGNKDDEEFQVWQHEHLDFWNSLIAASEGDLFVFQISSDRYERFILTKLGGHGYTFWALDAEKCSEVCIGPASLDKRDRDRVVELLDRKSDWGWYSLRDLTLMNADYKPEKWSGQNFEALEQVLRLGSYGRGSSEVLYISREVEFWSAVGVTVEVSVAAGTCFVSFPAGCAVAMLSASAAIPVTLEFRYSAEVYPKRRYVP